MSNYPNYPEDDIENYNPILAKIVEKERMEFMCFSELNSFISKDKGNRSFAEKIKIHS